MKKTFRIIFIVLIQIMLIKSSVFAIFLNKNSNTFSMNIAEPILEIINNNQININNNNLSDACEFSIKNYNTNKINQIQLKYQIEILSNNTNIQQIRLVKIINDNQVDQVLTNNKSDFYNLIATSVQEDKYKLYITYSDNNIPTTDTIKIRINTVQNQLEVGE